MKSKDLKEEKKISKGSLKWVFEGKGHLLWQPQQNHWLIRKFNLLRHLSPSTTFSCQKPQKCPTLGLREIHSSSPHICWWNNSQMVTYRFLNLILFKFQIESLAQLNWLHDTWARKISHLHFSKLNISGSRSSTVPSSSQDSLETHPMGLAVGFLPFCRVIQEA